MKRVVFKYGTGHPIPKSGKYLCTQVETLQQSLPDGEFTKNVLVWHYYEVELDDDGNAK